MYAPALLPVNSTLNATKIMDGPPRTRPVRSCEPAICGLCMRHHAVLSLQEGDTFHGSPVFALRSRENPVTDAKALQWWCGCTRPLPPVPQPVRADGGARLAPGQPPSSVSAGMLGLVALWAVDQLGHTADVGVALVGQIVRGTSDILAVANAEPAADHRADSGHGQVHAQRQEADVQRDAGMQSQVRQRPAVPAEMRAGDHAARPEARNLVKHEDAAGQPSDGASDEGPAMEPVCVQTDGGCREDLQDEDTAGELQVDGELRGEQKHHREGAQLYQQRGDAADLCFQARAGGRPDELAVDPPCEQVGRPDRHDRCRYQGTDG